MMTDKARYTLLTNVSFLQDNDSRRLRIYCRAVLISEGVGDKVSGYHTTIRGFGTDASWDNFCLYLEDDKLPFTLTPASDPSKLMGEKPIFAGNLLTLSDGTAYFLQCDDYNRPIDIHTQTGDICRIWDILKEKVAEYWHAPNMPVLHWTRRR